MSNCHIWFTVCTLDIVIIEFVGATEDTIILDKMKIIVFYVRII